jgi:hypothetical protein
MLLCKICATSDLGKLKGLYELRSVEHMPDHGSENRCVIVSNSSNVALAAVSQEIRHQRLGHLSSKRMLLLKDLAQGLAFEEEAQITCLYPLC